MICTVPAAKAQLISQLRAMPALADVAVHWGLVPTVPLERERMYVLGVRDLRRTSRYQVALRTESYVLVVLIEVHLAEVSQQVVEERAWTLFDALEDALAADPELDGVVWRAELDGAEEQESGATDQGWIVRVTARVAIRTEVAPDA